MSHKGLRLWKFYDEYCFSRLAYTHKIGNKEGLPLRHVQIYQPISVFTQSSIIVGSGP